MNIDTSLARPDDSAGEKARGMARLRPLCAVLALAGVLAGCGGGSSGSGTVGDTTNQNGGSQQPEGNGSPGGNNPPPDGGTPDGGTPDAGPQPVSASMVMSCPEGAGYQCSGAEIIRSDNGVALTSSGVQAYGRSTSDLAGEVADPTVAYGLAPASGGTAEFRLAKNASGVMSKPALLLKNLGLSWDGKTERPPIVDTFDPTQGRVELDANQMIRQLPLPDSADLNFYDYAVKGTAGTQAHYANNRYFPRDASNPPRCGNPSQCSVETTGIQNTAGDWSSGGTRPDFATAVRLHGEGDVHAGNGMPVNGQPTWLDGGSGFGVPFPGSKGYRGFENWGFAYGNLAAWVTQDTVQIHEWGASNEHTKMRRGIVAFGDVTQPQAVPTAGQAVYSGIAYGWHSSDGNADPSVFWAAATVTVNFATRDVTVAVENAQTYDAAATPLPAVSFSAAAKMGAAGQSVANYLTGTVDNGLVKGGVGGRYFGLRNGVPAEVGGAFTLTATSGKTVIGGFIARQP